MKKQKRMGKRPRESSKTQFADAHVVEQSVEKFNNIEFVISLLYKMMKNKELGVHIDEIEVPTCLREDRRGVERENGNEEEGEDICPPPIDPQRTSSS